MALDSELLDKFERDWNDALAHYEARTTASRMGNIQYDPSSRTFAPQEQDPKVAMGIQNELFGPLQSKWDILREGAARGRSATATPQFGSEWNTPMNLGGGQVARFNKLTGEKQMLNEATAGVSLADKEAAAIRKAQLASEIRVIDSEMMTYQKLLPKAQEADEKNAIMNRLSSLSRRKAALFAPPAAAAAPAALDESMFATRPDQMMRQRPRPTGFIGTLGGTNAFMSEPFVEEAAPAPVPVLEEGAAMEQGVPFQMFGRGGQVTNGIDFSGGGPSVDRSVRLLRVRQKGK